MTLKTIAVDAMGGDFGLDVTIPGALTFLQQQTDAALILVGDETKIRNALIKANASLERITIYPASEVVGMDEEPTSALKNKKDSSMRVAINQIKEGQAQAAVSAGNTGALMATARFVLKTIAGIDRPAIAKFLPGRNNHMTLVLDLGANVDCSSAQLLQFAIVGSQQVAALSPENTRPRVGLLNVGTEDIKGNATVKETHQLIQRSDLNFVGNVEGNAIFTSEVDVLVVDGFTGNAMLKSIEGAVKFVGTVVKEEFTRSIYNKLAALIALPTLKGFKRRLDPRRFNGAIFLGLRGVVIKSHGGTDAIGFCFALQEAYKAIKADSITKIQAGVAQQLAALEE
ncbi:phosphate acyltransferase PlsX [Snodgrassella alvi]|uniref:phosphate acyltransferase PlsX n=1 Tax=Snodgrassella alvi TaxID=1196083 RepID=UPI00351724A2